VAHFIALLSCVALLVLPCVEMLRIRSCLLHLPLDLSCSAGLIGSANQLS